VRGAIASMLTGALCIPLFKFAVPSIPVWGPVISKAEELGPSFLISLLAGIAVTLAARSARGS
jgi:Na+/proline symporter